MATPVIEVVAREKLCSRRDALTTKGGSPSWALGVWSPAVGSYSFSTIWVEEETGCRGRGRPRGNLLLQLAVSDNPRVIVGGDEDGSIGRRTEQSANDFALGLCRSGHNAKRRTSASWCSSKSDESLGRTLMGG
ncbi:unnamed protein product [Linum trigynum]|uniref:Uncharacterized protein n=1 Tax=Linum trigynum TaxID=586398 RepID=A0AAV2E182_9ROSI